MRETRTSSPDLPLERILATVETAHRRDSVLRIMAQKDELASPAVW
jgi:hypothetical protein